MTHKELVIRARRWLLNTERCSIVFAEPKASKCNESPDAIGWRHGDQSILVECKISVEDLYADKAKDFRKKFYKGMGCYRWIMAPKGVIKPELLLPHWGLLEVSGPTMRCYRKVEASWQICDQNEEVKLLVSRCWILQDSLKRYTREG